MDKNFRQGYWSGIQRSQKDFPRYERENATLSAPVSASTSSVKFGSYAPPRREVKGYQTVDSLFPRSTTMYVDNPAARSHKLHELKTANALNAMSRDDSHVDKTSRASGPRALSIQEQAGINTTFPGNTEYMTRYAWPKSDMKASRFTINPTPDFTLHGRPLGLTTYEPSFTEYQSRYEWPDGNRIVKLPWLRK
ncbi:hypothetical protein CHS0354_021164 [Potamilus streckersoni]|uniref:Uncharacterized protein n=1 Tax=Potamilus streckersoni TaxID=2493646 RepID=A0AAE0TI07_9BIVA|nr:hypothetical protein CHS0354_021164 [Potamilus streckersoni]